jgi:hypothetical protein
MLQYNYNCIGDEAEEEGKSHLNEIRLFYTEIRGTEIP